MKDAGQSANRVSPEAAKQAIGAKTCLYPMPCVLVGANVQGKPNYLTVAYCGIVQHQPPMLAITLNKRHYTNAGIVENGTFSVNIPSASMVEVTDYCGLVSGRQHDKSALFDTFYGMLGTAPMIRACPLSLECKLREQLDVGGTNDIFIGEIIEVYADERVLTNGVPDIRKIDPIIFSMYDNNYWRIGPHLARAWSVGKEFTPPG